MLSLRKALAVGASVMMSYGGMSFAEEALSGTSEVVIKVDCENGKCNYRYSKKSSFVSVSGSSSCDDVDKGVNIGVPEDNGNSDRKDGETTKGESAVEEEVVVEAPVIGTKPVVDEVKDEQAIGPVVSDENKVSEIVSPVEDGTAEKEDNNVKVEENSAAPAVEEESEKDVDAENVAPAESALEVEDNKEVEPNKVEENSDSDENKNDANGDVEKKAVDENVAPPVDDASEGKEDNDVKVEESNAAPAVEEESKKDVTAENVASPVEDASEKKEDNDIKAEESNAVPAVEEESKKDVTAENVAPAEGAPEVKDNKEAESDKVEENSDDGNVEKNKKNESPLSEFAVFGTIA